MENSLPFANPVLNLFQRLPVEEKVRSLSLSLFPFRTVSIYQSLYESAPASASAEAGGITYVAVTSDKGLCGGVNTAAARKKAKVLKPRSKWVPKPSELLKSAPCPCSRFSEFSPLLESQVAKQVRLGLAAEEAKGNAAKIMVVGGKARSRKAYGVGPVAP